MNNNRHHSIDMISFNHEQQPRTNNQYKERTTNTERMTYQL